MVTHATHHGMFGTLTVAIKDWHPGDPFPRLGSWVSNDNETELISVFKPIPELVVAGFYNPVDRTCYYVYPDGINEWYQHLYDQRVTVYMFNAAFDVPTAETPVVYQMLDEDLIMDVGINFQLYSIATKGDLAFDAMSLKGAAKKLLGMELDKGEDKGDEAARVTFHRNVPLTDGQRIYLSGDLVSTFKIGEAIAPQPTVYLQTRADLVLATMTRNGWDVDMEVWNALRNQVVKEMTEAKEKLLTFGFPFPKDTKASDPIDHFWQKMEALGVPVGDAPPSLSKTQQRLMLIAAYEFYIGHAEVNTDTEDAKELAQILFMVAQQTTSVGTLKAAHKKVYTAFIESIEAVAFDTAKIQASLFPLLLEMLNVLELGTADLSKVSESLDNHVQILEKKAAIGPAKFLQLYIENIQKQYPDLVLDTTPKSGAVKISKTDKWRLEDAGVKSEFLEAYVEYKHNEKLLSTYLKPDFIKEDGKIHPHFNVIVRTGRTSSGGYGSLNAWHFGRSKIW